MIQQFENKRVIAGYVLTLVLLSGLGVWMKALNPMDGWEHAGWINFSLGLVMLAAYVSARLLVRFQLPLISGYIFAGVLAGPYVSGFLTTDMVARFRLIDDLALSFIALTAGGTLHIKAFQERGKAIALNIFLITVVVFSVVFLFILFPGRGFDFTAQFTVVQLAVFAILMGVIAIARSPSSAIAIISECRAKGAFTETVLGVTIVMDVLIIIFFTIALSISQLLLSGGGMMDGHALMGLFLEISVSMLIGAMLGFFISWYISRVGHDLSLFLLVIAFAVTKLSVWLGYFVEARFDVSLHLEPLLICMSSGFTVRNFSRVSTAFMEGLEQSALPIYVLFFSLAGASLNFNALSKCWMFAVFLAVVRGFGIWGGTWVAGMILKDPKVNRRSAWMAYLTQAGVAIGLAQLVQRQAPEIGVYLTTVVLAVISINQIIGPITFKLALHRVGEVTVG